VAERRIGSRTGGSCRTAARSGPPGEGISGPAADCFDAALVENTGAELVVRGRTDEVVDYFRTVPGQVCVEVFTDSSEDSYGSVEWTFSRCPLARSLADLGDCAEESLRTVIGLRSST
jgi:hypothetical protein